MSNRFQILALDGGGIKVLFSAAFLSKLEDDLNTKITDHFDLVVGTSTGGIIALGLGLSPKELIEFYFTKAPRIFQKIPFLRDLLFAKYSGKTIESVSRRKMFRRQR